MNVRALRIAVLAGMALLLAITFFLMQFRQAREAILTAKEPPVLGSVPDFALVGRDGLTLRRADLAGEPWVADFVFTRCALACPRLTSIMRRLGADAPGVTRVSISVDPEYDTPQVLDDYATAYGVTDPRWRFLTGSPEAVESLVVGGFRVPLLRDPPPELATPEEPIVHSNRFVLVDGGGAIRGYYEVTEDSEYEKLLRDLGSLRSAQAAAPAESDMTAENPAISPAACEREVDELHRFFEDWFVGRLPDTDAAYERFARVLAPDFTIIGPSGVASERTPILERVRGGHGARGDGEFRIWIENTKVHDCGPERCLLTYEEWQLADGEERGRLSTVLFGARPDAPNGIEWLHVHETWLPESDESE